MACCKRKNIRSAGTMMKGQVLASNMCVLESSCLKTGMVCRILGENRRFLKLTS